MQTHSHYPDWLKIATTFDLGKSIMYNNRNISIESRLQRDTTIKWIFKMDSWVLGKDSRFYYEPMPSSRTEGFLFNTRYDTKEAAFDSWLSHIDKGKIHTLFIDYPSEPQ